MDTAGKGIIAMQGKGLDRLRQLTPQPPHGSGTPEAALAHIEEAAQSIAHIYIAHHRSADRHQRRIERVTAFLGEPWFIAIAGLLMLNWIGLNVLAPMLGYTPIDPPPFAGIAAAISLISLCIMLLVLTTQRRENALAEKREQLTLQLAVLSERKAAKIIELLEEFRRDLPIIEDREDEQAKAMAQPADPETALEVIAETQAEVERQSRHKR